MTFALTAQKFLSQEKSPIYRESSFERFIEINEVSEKSIHVEFFNLIVYGILFFNPFYQ